MCEVISQINKPWGEWTRNAYGFPMFRKKPEPITIQAIKKAIEILDENEVKR